MKKKGFFRHRDPTATGARLDAMMFLARAEHRRVRAYLEYKWKKFCKPALQNYINEKENTSVDMKSEEFTNLSQRKQFSLIRHDTTYDFKYVGGNSKTDYAYTDFVQSDWGDFPSRASRYNSFLDALDGRGDDSDTECGGELTRLKCKAIEYSKTHTAIAATNHTFDDLLNSADAIARYGSTLPLNFEKYRAETIERYVGESGVVSGIAARDDSAKLYRNVSPTNEEPKYEIYTAAQYPAEGDTYVDSFSDDGDALEESMSDSHAHRASSESSEFSDDDSSSKKNEVEPDPMGDDSSSVDSNSSDDASSSVDSNSSDDASSSVDWEELENGGFDDGTSPRKTEQVVWRYADKACDEIVDLVKETHGNEIKKTHQNGEDFFLYFLDKLEGKNEPLRSHKTKLVIAHTELMAMCKQIGRFPIRNVSLPSGALMKMVNGLCYSRLHHMYDLRWYGEFNWMSLKHPWAIFMHYYISKQYQSKHSPNPIDAIFDDQDKKPQICTDGYSICFDDYVPRGNLKGHTFKGPSVTTKTKIANEGTEFFIYHWDASERTREMVSLKGWVDRIEKSDSNNAPTQNYSRDGFDYAPLCSMSDISLYSDNDDNRHMWALFLQFFIGSLYDRPPRPNCRTVKPMELFFQTGVIYGKGYTVRMMIDKAVLCVSGSHTNIQYDIYAADVHTNTKNNFDLRSQIEKLENNLLEPVALS